MSSILTNSSAMVALDTLRGINNNLGQVQSEISTGKKISSSTDNAAIWSIATVMQSDVDSFTQVSDSLNLGSATVGVAQSASEQVTDLLQKAKTAIVSANDASVTDADRAKYQTDLTEITGNISSIVEAASFNGQNLLQAGDDLSVLASLNRQADGTVTTGNISVARQDLSTNAAVTGGTVATTDAGGAVISDTGGDNTLSGAGGTETITITAGETSSKTNYSFDLGAGNTVEYSAAPGLNEKEVAAGLSAAINRVAKENDLVGVSADFENGVVTITNDGADITGVSATATVANETQAAGGLRGLENMDIGTETGASNALSKIDALLQTAIDATASFGSKQSRIDNQNEFVTTLSDSLKTGIGALTDANLEEASARLQSLQVQQQLGVQALSIANSGPQQLLSLFR